MFGYDFPAAIRLIEEHSDRGFVQSWSQLPESPDNNIPELSYILRGPLSTVPIEGISPAIATSADYRFYSFTNERGRPQAGYGTPDKDPFGNGPPNLYAPLPVDRTARH